LSSKYSARRAWVQHSDCGGKLSTNDFSVGPQVVTLPSALHQQKSPATTSDGCKKTRTRIQEIVAVVGVNNDEEEFS
jgi:hypothetical protein